MTEVDAQELETATRANDDAANTKPALARRTVLGVGAAGVAGVALAACSSGGSGSSGGSSSASAGGSASGSGSSSANGTVVTATASVPVGGAKLAKADGTTWLVAQPKSGEYVCHSGICTHQGCPLTEIVGQEGVCNCHGSRFDVNTGAVLKGPATQPLPKQSVKVAGSNVVLG